MLLVSVTGFRRCVLPIALQLLQLPFFADDIEASAKTKAGKSGNEVPLLLSKGKKSNGAENRYDHQEDELKQFRPPLLDMRKFHARAPRAKIQIPPTLFPGESPRNRVEAKNA